MPGTWMQTATGRKFDVLDPSADSICITDVALSLSKKCRYNGHTKGFTFYSVAEHCCRVHDVLMARHQDPVIGLYGLLHDAPEAYSPFGDVPRPLKDNVAPKVREYEYLIEGLLYSALGLPRPSERQEALIDRVDKGIVEDERCAVMANPPEDWDHRDEAVGAHIEAWGVERAFNEFMQRFAARVGDYNRLMEITKGN